MPIVLYEKIVLKLYSIKLFFRSYDQLMQQTIKQLKQLTDKTVLVEVDQNSVA